MTDMNAIGTRPSSAIGASSARRTDKPSIGIGKWDEDVKRRDACEAPRATG